MYGSRHRETTITLIGSWDDLKILIIHSGGQEGLI